jgi:hypothetical protein
MVLRSPMPRDPMCTRSRSRVHGPMPGDPAIGGPMPGDPFGSYRRRSGINNPDRSVPEKRADSRGRWHCYPCSLKMEPALSMRRRSHGIPGGRRPDNSRRWRPVWRIRRRRQHGVERIQQNRSGYQTGNNHPIPIYFFPVHRSSFLISLRAVDRRKTIRNRFLKVIA